MEENLLTWYSEERGATPKTRAWYTSVMVIAGGAAVASVIGGNYLLAVVAIVGAFAVMLAGSRPPAQHRCSISERGIHIGNDLVAFPNIKSFSIEETATPRLTLKTSGVIGTLSLMLSGVDFRAVRSVLKNHSIEEEEYQPTVGEWLAKSLGL